MSETILIVDDEESVRRTFQEWLRSSPFECEVIAVGDSESALTVASKTAIDLAILDWNLGSGSDGLQLLEDLVEFHSDLVAILVTGFAHQATPLEALRMGVRDYLDKNQDLNRDSFLTAVKRQLDRIMPAKRQRQFTRSLQTFRDSLEKVLPLVQGASQLNEPVPLSEGIRQLFRFLQRTTKAEAGVLVIRQSVGPEEKCVAYSVDGELLSVPLVPFADSLAATAVSMQEPCLLNAIDPSSLGPVQLQSFEKDRKQLLLSPLPIGPGTHVVLELFDKRGGIPFTDEDRILVAAACEFGSELFRHAFSEKETRSLLLQAIESALKVSRQISSELPKESDAPTETVMKQLREGLASSLNPVVDASSSLRLTEAIRTLATRHGSPAVDHCLILIENLNDLLDRVTGYLEQ